MWRIPKFGYLLILMSLLQVACTNQEANYLTELCVVREKGTHKYLLTDDGRALYPSSSLDTSIYKDSTRFKVTYILLKGDKSQDGKESVVDIMYMLPVFVKGAISRADLTANLNSPVWLLSKPWPGGGFLNFEFAFGYADISITHGIYLVRDSLVLKSGRESLYLTFGHNAKGDLYTKTATALVSFPLKTVFNKASADSLPDSLIVNVLDGSRRVVYRLGVSEDYRY